MEFGESLISLLPVDSIAQARKQLRELGVRVIRLGTLLERMSYDQEILIVEAGKPVEFIFRKQRHDAPQLGHCDARFDGRDRNVSRSDGARRWSCRATLCSAIG
jgi:hypothetical protein